MKVEINALVSYTEVHDEIVLANMETGKYFTIGGSGNRIWKELIKGKEVENIIDTLAEVYQTEKHTISKDVQEFLDTLEQYKFIRRISDKNGI